MQERQQHQETRRTSPHCSDCRPLWSFKLRTKRNVCYSPSRIARFSFKHRSKVLENNNLHKTNHLQVRSITLSPAWRTLDWTDRGLGGSSSAVASETMKRRGEGGNRLWYVLLSSQFTDVTVRMLCVNTQKLLNQRENRNIFGISATNKIQGFEWCATRHRKLQFDSNPRSRSNWLEVKAKLQYYGRPSTDLAVVDLTPVFRTRAAPGQVVIARWE